MMMPKTQISCTTIMTCRFTFDKRLYMYERHTYDEMTYTLPVKSGKNTIILKFAEVPHLLLRCISHKSVNESLISALEDASSGKTSTSYKKWAKNMLPMNNTSKSISRVTVLTIREKSCREPYQRLATKSDCPSPKEDKITPSCKALLYITIPSKVFFK